LSRGAGSGPQVGALKSASMAYQGGVRVFKPPGNSEDSGGVLDRISKKNRRLDFLL